MLAFLRPARHYRRPGLLNVPILLVCAQLAELLTVIALDDNLHPQRQGPSVTEWTARVIDLLVQAVGPPALVVLLAVVMMFGAAGEAFLGLVGVIVGAVLVWTTIGDDGVILYLYVLVILRVMVWVVFEVIVYPLRFVIAFLAFTVVIWTVTR